MEPWMVWFIGEQCRRRLHEALLVRVLVGTVYSGGADECLHDWRVQGTGVPSSCLQQHPVSCM